MFNNVGNKIKGVAKVFCWLGIIGSVIGGLSMIYIGLNSRHGEELIIYGLLITVLGSLLSWIGSLFTYGFGELVQNSCVQTELAVKNHMENI